ncbi:MAG: pre-16S rRNA-processing nuclease YqgF [Candidatus Riflebacteria bacterium]|nr:pre-16S rRNA-processing nuclease YqgF [Candidatus Riflebacteria bacterium]
MTTEKRRWILAIDPGRAKVGYAQVYDDFSHGEMGVAELTGLSSVLKKFCKNTEDPPFAIVVGSGTASNIICKLFKNMDTGISIKFQNEKNTTLMARERYFEENPPKGLFKLIPRGLLSPGEAIDGYAAWIIGEKYMKELSKA